MLVCTLFLNFYLDLQAIENEITSEVSLLFYNAQVSTAQVVCLVSGACLFLTPIVMLLFYIKHYIDSHKKELGILKTLGYSNFSIAKHFWVFGYSQKECCKAILSGYRPVSYIGFAIGTLYQYTLLRVMIDLVFKDVDGVAAYEFDVPIMLLSLAVFILLYEILMNVWKAGGCHNPMPRFGGKICLQGYKAQLVLVGNFQNRYIYQ